MSSGSADSLMDVFVNIKPEPEMLKAFNETIANTVKNTREMLNGLQATADITAAKMVTVSGAGSRAGGGGGGGTAASGAVNEIREARELLRRLELSASRVSQFSAQTGIPELEIGVARIKDTIKELRLTISEQAARGDILGIEKSVQQIKQVEEAIYKLQKPLTIEGVVKVDIRKSIAEIEDAIKVKKVGIELTRPQVVGSASSEDRQKIYLLIGALREAEIAADRFKKQINDGPEALERYKGALIGVETATEALGAGLSEIEQIRGKSFNNLANNAYQLGQAFEDAAIGYQLNGITGAVRGASNNIAFLLNDLSRVPDVQQKLASTFGTTAKKVQDFLPLIAGVGTALAVTVLPPAVEWLESLNDVDLKIRDISESLKSEFKDTDLKIRIAADERSLARSVSDLGSVEDILKKISDMQSEVTDKTLQLQQTFRGLQGSSNLEEVKSQFTTISKAASVEISRLEKNLATFRSLTAISGIKQGPSQEQAIRTKAEISSLEGLQRSIETMKFEMDLAQDQAAKGFFDDKQIQNIKRTLFSINEELKTFTVSAGSVDKEFSSKLIANVTALAERFDKIGEVTANISSITGKQLTSAIEAAVSKTIELADKQALLRRQIEGAATEQSMFLLDVREISRVYAELIDQTVEFYRQQGQDPAGIQEILRQQEIFASENRILEQQKTLAEKLKDAEEKLGQLREKNGENQSRRSRQTTLEALSTGLQESVLSIESNSVKDNTDAISELTGEITGLNFEIARLNATRENLQTQFTDPTGFALKQRGISFTQGLAPIDLMGPFAGVNAAVREAGAYAPAAGEILSGAAMTEAVRAGIEQALQKVLPTLKEGQNGIKDAIKQQDTKARAAQ